MAPDLRPIRPGSDRRIDMKSDDGIETVGRALAHHFLTAAGKCLLGRLEDDPNFAGQRLQPGQRQGDAGPDGGMDVVAAGMHDRGNLGAEIEAFGFLNRQGVEIGPKPDSRAAGPISTVSPVLGVRVRGLKPVAPKFVDHQFGGLVFLVGEFGLAMDGSSEATTAGRRSATTARISSDLAGPFGGNHRPGCYRGSGRRTGRVAWRPRSERKRSVLEEAVFENSARPSGRAPIFLAERRTVVVTERSGQPGVLLAIERDRVVDAGGLQEQAVADLGAQAIGRRQMVGLAA